MPACKKGIGLDGSVEEVERKRGGMLKIKIVVHVFNLFEPTTGDKFLGPLPSDPDPSPTNNPLVPRKRPFTTLTQ